MTSCPNCGSELPPLESPLAKLFQRPDVARTFGEAEERQTGIPTMRCRGCGTHFNVDGEPIDDFPPEVALEIDAAQLDAELDEQREVWGLSGDSAEKSDS